MKSTVLALVLGCCLAGAAVAQPVEATNSTTLWFEKWEGLSGATLTVVAPNGRFFFVRSDRGTPVFNLPSRSLDGVYEYELSAATTQLVEIVNPIDNGREKEPRANFQAFSMTGSFAVFRGVIVPDEAVVEDTDRSSQ